MQRRADMARQHNGFLTLLNVSLLGCFLLLGSLDLALGQSADTANSGAEAADAADLNDMPIDDLKKPAGSGDDDPVDMLFDEPEPGAGKPGKLSDDADVPDSSGFSEEERRQLQEFKLGPTIALGIPHPLSYGVDFLYGGRFGGSFSLGSVTTKGNGTSLSLSHWDARMRWFPWRSAFFAGAAFGSQKATGEVSKDGVDGGAAGKFDATMSLTVKTTYVTPHVGWDFIWDSGFVVGFDAGVQVPVGNKGEFSTKFDGNLTAEQTAQLKASEDHQKLQDEADDVAKKIGKTVLPYLTLVRVGWLF